MIRLAGLGLALLLSAGQLSASETLRIATYNVELQRDGPGLLLRDIRKGKDPQIRAVIAVIAATRPDILALQGVDWDYDGKALDALVEALRAQGVDYPFRFAEKPNSGVASGLDLNGNGRLGEAEDSWGFGAFTGQAGLAVLSRYPIDVDAVQSFTALPWADLPDAQMPNHPDGTPFPSAAVQAQIPLSVSALWSLPIRLPDDSSVNLLTYRASPPVFDGPEDMNGLRNADETRFWSLYLDGRFAAPPQGRFVLAGQPNMDPHDSDGRPQTLRTLLADPRLQDPAPTSPGAARAPDQGHQNPNAQDTVDWPGPGRLRVDYVLPSANWPVAASGVYWPAPGQPGHEDAVSASRHRLVWVDMVLRPAP